MCRYALGAAISLRSRSLDPADARRHAMPRHKRCHAIRDTRGHLCAGLQVAFTPVSHLPEASSHVAHPHPPVKGPLIHHQCGGALGGVADKTGEPSGCRGRISLADFSLGQPHSICSRASHASWQALAISSRSHRQLHPWLHPSAPPRPLSSGRLVKREFRRRAA